MSCSQQGINLTNSAQVHWSQAKGFPTQYIQPSWFFGDSRGMFGGIFLHREAPTNKADQLSIYVEAQLILYFTADILTLVELIDQ